MPAFAPTRAERRALEAENRSLPLILRQIPREQWPLTVALVMDNPPTEAWQSRNFLLQVFAEPDGVVRLSVCRTQMSGQGWKENITWDDLQRLKAECGRGDQMAVEVYPPDRDVVNVANMRHLWVLPVALPFAWRR